MVTYTMLTVYMYTHQQNGDKEEPETMNVSDIQESAAREMHEMIRNEQVRERGAPCERNDSYNSPNHYARSKSVDFDADSKRK